MLQVVVRVNREHLKFPLRCSIAYIMSEMSVLLARRSLPQ